MKENMRNYEIDYSNIDLHSLSERESNIIDRYNFDTLLIEIDRNIQEINAENVEQHFNDMLQSKIDSARSMFKDNLNNIVKYAIKYRDSI